jgi:NAD dependent epimerase/dehydratase
MWLVLHRLRPLAWRSIGGHCPSSERRRSALADLVAVTGAEGFIGSHLVETLVAAGSRVRAMVLYNSFGSWGWLETLPSEVLDNVEVVAGDVRDDTSVHEFLRGAEVVYHLAALIAIPYSYRAPRSYLETNASGTLNVLEAARRQETPRVVCTSTSEVYGTALQVPIDERHPLQAQSPYSASKIAADKIAEAYHLSFGSPVVTLRPFNTFGPRQSARAVIPAIVSQLAAGQREVRLGALQPTRDFTFVKDTAAAFLAVGSAPAERVVGQVLNAGTGREISIGDLLRMIGQLMDRDVRPVVEEDRLRPERSEVMRLVCDATRLRELTGWEPRYSLEDGLRETIAWLGDPANLGRYKPAIYNL